MSGGEPGSAQPGRRPNTCTTALRPWCAGPSSSSVSLCCCAQVLEGHQQFRRVHGSACAVVHLVGMIGLEDETAAGAQAGGGRAVHVRAQSGRQVDECRDDARPRARANGEGAEVGRDGGQDHAVARGELAGLREAHGRLVDGGDRVAAPGEEHRVTALALAEAQDGARGELRGAFGDEGVRLRSVAIVERAVTPIPEASVVGHRRGGRVRRSPPSSRGGRTVR
ncbi:MAG: hypothetical protein RL479_2617 [Verrucomicrobiota bacterium]